MFVLKGNSGKGKILYPLMEAYHNCICVAYDNLEYKQFPFGTYAIDVNECNVNEFCNELYNLVYEEIFPTTPSIIRKEKEFVDMVIVYTNLKEEEISGIKDVIKRLERAFMCIWYGNVQRIKQILC